MQKALSASTSCFPGHSTKAAAPHSSLTPKRRDSVETRGMMKAFQTDQCRRGQELSTSQVFTDSSFSPLADTFVRGGKTWVQPQKRIVLAGVWITRHKPQFCSYNINLPLFLEPVCSLCTFPAMQGCSITFLLQTIKMLPLILFSLAIPLLNVSGRSATSMTSLLKNCH